MAKKMKDLNLFSQIKRSRGNKRQPDHLLSTLNFMEPTYDVHATRTSKSSKGNIIVEETYVLWKI